MHAAIRLATLIWLAVSAPLMAQENPVVVELFTSQGCSSCPQADAYFLEELAGREDVIALALHVDYWDYIGWKDHFADPRFTKRQKAYAKAAGHRTVYTPQMIVAGQDHVIGTHPEEVGALVRQRAADFSPVQLQLERQGGSVIITANTAQLVGPVLVQLVRYQPLETVMITRGENAGRTVKYANIVQSWTQLGAWDGREQLTLKAKAPGSMPVVAILQMTGNGPVLAAARLK